jgi:hypothetical protein
MFGKAISETVLALALVLALAPAGAGAQNVQRTDPNADSPAGVIYQIPLDTARRDAAPTSSTARHRSDRNVDGAGSGGSGGAGGSGGSAGGSGSDGGATGATGGSAPGGGGADRAATGSGGDSTLTAGGTEPSSIHSENGFGTSDRIPGVDGEAALPAAGTGGGVSGSFALLALIALASSGLGVALSRAVCR